MFLTRSHARAALAAVWTVSAGIALAGEDPPPTGAESDQRIEGVIVKVEPIGGSEQDSVAPRRVRLTINTAVVWRDYARDTAAARETSPEKAARKGEESVATKGQPGGRNNLVTVDVTPAARMELRYRAAMDERSFGAASVEEARRLATQAAPRPRGLDDGSAGRPATLAQLKPGLFVHVRYHRVDQHDRANRLVILEPVLDEPVK
jgi:hypothetical protein